MQFFWRFNDYISDNYSIEEFTNRYVIKASFMTLSLEGEVTQSFLNLLYFNFTHDLGEPVFSQEPI